MIAGPLLVTGGAGFVGRAVLHQLAASAQGTRLRLLVHRTTPPLADGGAVECHVGDLAAPHTLRGACEGVHTVLHLASHVADDPGVCDAVNARGTEALVAAAGAAGARRIIYLSTAAVYGYAIHRDAAEEQTAVMPATPVSRSRARAERAVLRAGGIVLRPLFVYGNGDTRFVPVLVRACRRFPVLVDGGKARVSVVAVDDLAAVITALAMLPDGRWQPGPYHVTDGEPITLRDLLRALGRALGFTPPSISLPYWLTQLALRVAGGRAMGTAYWSPSARHRLFLVARDHSYDSARLWDLLGFAPGAPFQTRIAQYAQWYRQFLNPAAAGPQ